MKVGVSVPGVRVRPLSAAVLARVMVTVYDCVVPSAAVTVTVMTFSPTASGQSHGAAPLQVTGAPPLAAATTPMASLVIAAVAVTRVLAMALLTIAVVYAWVVVTKSGVSGPTEAARSSSRAWLARATAMV
jgi:hypothetical protein